MKKYIKNKESILNALSAIITIIIMGLNANGANVDESIVQGIFELSTDQVVVLIGNLLLPFYIVYQNYKKGNFSWRGFVTSSNVFVQLLSAFILAFAGFGVIGLEVSATIISAIRLFHGSLKIQKANKEGNSDSSNFLMNAKPNG